MGKLLTTLFGIFFAIAGPLAIAAGGYWWGVDRPAWSFGPCPVCVRLGPGSGVKLAALEAAETKAAQRAAMIDKGSAEISANAGLAQTQVQTKIKIIYRDIIKEIPNVITSEIDHSFPLSNAFVRVHDAAANGFSLSDISHSTSQLDNSASSVTASNAATVIATNYSKCQQDDAQLNSLIAWVKDQQTNFNLLP